MEVGGGAGAARGDKAGHGGPHNAHAQNQRRQAEGGGQGDGDGHEDHAGGHVGEEAGDDHGEQAGDQQQGHAGHSLEYAAEGAGQGGLDAGVLAADDAGEVQHHAGVQNQGPDNAVFKGVHRGDDGLAVHGDDIGHCQAQGEPQTHGELLADDGGQGEGGQQGGQHGAQNGDQEQNQHEPALLGELFAGDLHGVLVQSAQTAEVAAQHILEDDDIQKVQNDVQNDAEQHINGVVQRNPGDLLKGGDKAGDPAAVGDDVGGQRAGEEGGHQEGVVLLGLFLITGGAHNALGQGQHHQRIDLDGAQQGGEQQEAGDEQGALSIEDFPGHHPVGQGVGGAGDPKAVDQGQHDENLPHGGIAKDAGDDGSGLHPRQNHIQHHGGQTAGDHVNGDEPVVGNQEGADQGHAQRGDAPGAGDAGNEKRSDDADDQMHQLGIGVGFFRFSHSFSPPILSVFFRVRPAGR